MFPRILVTFLLFFVSTFAQAEDLSSLCGFKVGEQFPTKPISASPVQKAALPLLFFRAPVAPELKAPFLDVEIGVSQLSSNVFRVRAERATASEAQCNGLKAELVQQLQKSNSQNFVKGSVPQFVSKDGSRSIEVVCTISPGHPYYLLSVMLLDTSEEKQVNEYLEGNVR